MFKKLCIIFLSLFLIVTLFCSSTVTVIAETKTEENNEVYYSDLFYAYSHSYLTGHDFNNYATETFEVTKELCDEYMDSGLSIFSKLEGFFTDWTDIKQLMLHLSSLSGEDLVYNEAIDAANIAFMKKLSSDIYGDLSENFEWKQEKIENVDNIVSFYEGKKEVLKNKAIKEIVDSCFENMKNSKLLKNIPFDSFDKIKTSFEKDLEMLSSVSTAMDASIQVLNLLEAVDITLMMHSVDLGMIDTIIKNCPTRGALYDGMVRLRNQIGNNFGDYFVSNYLTKNFMSGIVEALEKIGSEISSPFKFAFECIKLIEKVTFDVIIPVADHQEIFIQRILCEYSTTLESAIRKKVRCFQNQFNHTDVTEYRTLLEAYFASTNASLDATDPIALFSNQSKLNTVKNKYSNYSVAEYILSVASNIESIPFSDRLIKNYENWTINEKTCISDSSNELKTGYIYAFNGAFRSNLSIQNEVTISDDLTITGDISISGQSATFIVDPLYECKIGGNVNVNSNGSLWNKGVLILSGSDKTISIGSSGKFINDLIFYCNGSFKTTYSSSKVIQSKKDAVMFIRGDMTLATPSNEGNISGGKIIFDGTEKKQTVNAQVFNCEVKNLEGITGNLHVYGDFNLRLKPFDGTIYAHEGATFVYGSDYNKVVINEPFTLRSNVIADFDISGTNAKLTVKTGSAYSIYGNISVSGGNSNNMPTVYVEPAASLYISENANVSSYGIIENHGSLNVGGNTQVNYSGIFKSDGTAYLNGDLKTNSNDSKIIQESNSAKMYVRGNINLALRNNNALISGGTLILDGTMPQTVYGQAYNVEILNKAATMGNLYVYGKVNGNSNPWIGTFYAFDGATFVDGSNYNQVMIVNEFTMRSNINANVTVSGTGYKLIIPSDKNFTIGGTLSIQNGNNSNRSSVIINQNAILNVLKDVNLTSYGILENLGTINIGGNTQVNYSGIFKNNGTAYLNGDLKTNSNDSKIIQESNSAKMYVRGNINLALRNNNALISGGTLILDGTMPQTVYGQAYNVEILNKAATMGDLYVYGKVNGNSNPWVGTFYAFDGATFVDGSNYNQVMIVNEFTMRSNINASVTVAGTGYKLIVPSGSNFTIGGTLSAQDGNSSNGSSVIINQNAVLNVLKDVNLTSYGIVENLGTLNIGGNTQVNYSGVFKNNGTAYLNGDLKTNSNDSKIIQESSTAKMHVRGNINLALRNNNALISGGTLILDGTMPQTVYGQAYNVEILNKAATMGNLYVYGKVNGNSNPWIGTFYAFDGATFVDGSNYNQVMIVNEFTMRSNINASVTVAGTGYKLIVPSGSNFTIGGTLSAQDGNSSNGSSVIINQNAVLNVLKDVNLTSYGIVENLGTLNIGGNTQVNYSGVFKNNGTAYLNGDLKTNSNDSKIIQEMNKANLLIKGNVSLASKTNCVLNSGKVTFVGNEIQYVSGFNASTIVIDKNSIGTVYFQSDINPSVLFNHKGNSFIVTTNSTFVDYDYDGITDEADPNPTDLDLAKFVDACDVNDDGIIDILDLVLLKNELIKATEEIDKKFDIDNDGLTNAIDLKLMKKVLLAYDSKKLKIGEYYYV